LLIRLWWAVVLANVATAEPGGVAYPVTRLFTGSAPLHPFLIEPLVEDVSDSRPAVPAVDVDGTGREMEGAKLEIANGMITANREAGGWVAYRYLGETNGGLHVLAILVNTGGSGVFEDLVVVKLVSDRVLTDGVWRSRRMLLLVASMTLGDRDDGAIRIDGNRVVVSKSRYRIADTVIDLSMPDR
jgi:hypothetical protein